MLTNDIKEADFLIDHFNLQPHPEGGYFKETYRSDKLIKKNALGENFTEDHVYSTAIYFLLKSGEKSKFHKIKQDEMWHYYFGSPLKVIAIDNNGKVSEHILSPNIKNGHAFQALVPANTWLAAYPLEQDSYTLVGCTVAPGFEFSDFTMAEREELLAEYPRHEELIKKLT